FIYVARIRTAVISLTCSVCKKERSLWHIERLLRIREYFAILSTIACFHAYRNGPRLRFFRLRTWTQEESLLSSRNIAPLQRVESEYGHAWLHYKTFHDLINRFVAFGGLRVPKIFSCCLAVHMSSEIVVHATAKCLFAKVIFNHQQDGSGLAI